MAPLVDDIRSRISELRENDFKPTRVVLSPDSFSAELKSELDLETEPYNVMSNLDRDFVVCFEDRKEDSPLALPTPEQIRNKIVNRTEFEELDPEVARENGYDDVEEGDEGLMAEVFVDVNKKGIRVLEENVENLGMDVDEFPLEEEEKEAEDGFKESIEFGVVSKDFEKRSKEDLREEMQIALTDEIAETIYSGEFIYPYSYKQHEDAEKVRVGEEYYIFDKVMIPQE